MATTTFPKNVKFRVDTLECSREWMAACALQSEPMKMSLVMAAAAALVNAQDEEWAAAGATFRQAQIMIDAVVECARSRGLVP